METTKEKTKVPRNIHHGHAIRRIRLDEGLTQKELGELVCLVQQAVSTYEEQENIDDEMLGRFAKALKVPVELIKNLEDNKSLVEYIQNNNTFTNAENGTSVIASPFEGGVNTSYQADKNLFTALEQMQKLYSNSIELYDKLLKSTEEKISMLEKEISQLKKSN